MLVLCNGETVFGYERQAFDLSGGALTVPITVITKEDDSKEVVVGYNLSRLVPAVA
jgi:hypothetical protein